MATIVCQGLQSCLESQIGEPRTTLRLRLSSPRVPHFSEPPELAFKSCFLDSNTKPIEEKCRSEKNHPQVPESDSDNSSIADPDSWSFLEAITNGGQLETNKADKDQNTYVHPLSKRSSSSLSDKSLELCTENLGSETGTDIIEDNMFSLSDSSSSSNSVSGNFATREQKKSHQLLATKKASSCRSFPPPLTTMSGLESLQVRTHREDGRLIIKAVKAPSPHSLFHAERSHGRLRLSIFKDSLPPFDSEEQEEQEEIANEKMSTVDTTDLEDDTTQQQLEKEEEIHLNNSTNSEEEEEEEEVSVEESENDAYREEEMDENKREVGGEMGRKKFQRPGRCKEGESNGEKKNIGSLWEPKPFWVATS